MPVCTVALVWTVVPSGAVAVIVYAPNGSQPALKVPSGSVVVVVQVRRAPPDTKTLALLTGLPLMTTEPCSKPSVERKTFLGEGCDGTTAAVAMLFATPKPCRATLSEYVVGPLAEIEKVPSDAVLTLPLELETLTPLMREQS